MIDVLLFHHAQGRTSGITAFAGELEKAGHTVHVPDLYDGRVFEDLESGVGYAQEVGFDDIVERGAAAASALAHDLAYLGISLGVMPAQKLVQTRPGARGAVLISACVPPETFGSPWPNELPAQVHGMDGDDFFVGDGDLDAARALASSAADVELFLYSGDRHLFIDNSLSSFDDRATALLTQRVADFLDSIQDERT